MAQLTDKCGSGGDVEESDIDEHEIRPPFDPMFDLRFPGHDVLRGKAACLEGAGQGTGQQIAAGDQDPSGGSRRARAVSGSRRS